MKKILFITIMIAFALAQSSSITACSCAQLLNQTDCENNASQLKCSWNATTKACSVNSTPVTPTTTTYAAYCDSFTEITCPQQKECAWLNKTCTFFTSCTPFNKTQDAECQAISNRCITDGTHCVEVTTCSAFLKQTPCVVNSSKQYCYWDTTKGCIDATTCEQLPASLNTDAQCRAQISSCTTTGTGCKTSGTDCKDQTAEISCKSNLTTLVKCYWDATLASNNCVDAICANAPKSLTSDKQCIDFQADGKCTTKSGGGCQTRGTCDDAKIQAACVTNSTGGICFWNGSACVDKTCANAPSTYITNSACQGYKGTCITNGNGCVDNTGCSAATIETACEKTVAGNACIWDKDKKLCKDKTCLNAPSTNNTHSLCSAFSTTCTVNSTNNGCIPRTCDNAPKEINSNTDCESYLPGYKCIAKLDGGCVTNTYCNAIKLDKACVIDAQQVTCFWDPDAKVCVDKTCTNAPTSYKDDTACFSYLKTCTVNQSGAGCVDRTCENLPLESLCTTNSDNKPCIYKPLCYQKQCSLAPTSYTSHTQCKEYLSSCTLSSTGYGCTIIPLVCTANVKINCNQKFNSATNTYSDCGWNGTSCIDKGCTTIDKAITTTTDCNTAIPNCVSANPVGGNVSGCIDLPTTCAQRQSVDNCQIPRANYPTCLWNAATSSCIEKTCLTALISGLTGVIASASQTNCNGYITGCLVSNDGNSCIAQVANCGLLSSEFNCIDKAKVGGDCFWTGSKCVDKTCSNINKTTHDDCQNVLPTCTVAQGKSSCMALGACTSYQIQEQCHFNASNQQCTWDSATGKCNNTPCTSASNSSQYDTDSKCQGFLTGAGTCTVIYKVGTKGCVARSNCSDYVDQNQCVKNSAGALCVWNNSKCFLKSAIVCADIVLGTYNNANCEGVAYYCKANSTTACQTKSCADYTTTNGITGGTAISQNSHCQALNTSCAVTEATCQDMKATCDGYGSEPLCTVSQAGACVWKTSGTDACILASTATCASYAGADNDACKAFGLCINGGGDDCEASDCATVAGTVANNSLTFTACQAVDKTCVNASSKNNCITGKSTCEGYSTTQTSCTYDLNGNQCFWNASTCVTITSSTCTLITTGSLNKADCQAYSKSCTAARDGSKCVPIVTQCQTITTLNNCVESTSGTCIQSNATDASASCKDITATTACSSLLLKQGTTYDQATCTGLLSTCTFASGGTTCVAKTCGNTATKSGFTASFANCNAWLSSCTFDGTNCVAISATCAAQSFSACYQATEGECAQFNGACVKKTCDTAVNSASTPFVTDSNCSTYLSTCTVARVGGCQARQASCTSYLSAIQCVKDASGKACTWNTVTLKCADLTCANLDTTYSVHSTCYDAITTSPRCTVKSSNGTVTTGCQALGSCSSYLEPQCFVNSSGAECEWNTNLDTPACQDKSCSTAPKASVLHSTCQSQMKDQSCTVAVVLDASGNKIEQGCQALAACSTYQTQEQCQIDSKKNPCGWNGSTCADKSCATAPSENDTHDKCGIYYPGCTVNSTKNGCTAITGCGSYTIEEQCVVDNNDAECYWLSASNTCITKTCSNAPSDITSAQGCDDYLPGCTLDDVKCKTKICEDFALATDALCTQSLDTCTSNGTYCVKRGTCAQAQTSVACVTSSDGKKCQWVEATTTTAAYCINRSCSTAPKDLITESACQQYYNGCTAATGGGCTVKGLCAVSSQAACNTDTNGKTCIWDTTSNSCRNKVCSDYAGKTHAECQKIDTTCTAGANGYCATQTTCAKTTTQQGCITGTDGNCLWIAKYVNGQTSGACFKYSECSSLSWTSNTQCNWISSNCTTDGSKCIGISLCTETNTNGGCINGYDGTCIQTVDALNSVNPAKCYAFTSCDQAFYATHDDCQKANSKCTTSGTGCIALGACSSYTSSAGCVINNVGPVSTSGAITSTGVCAWDNATSTCKDQVCADLQGTTHASCSQQLSTCTSNGTACITKAACSTYSSITACQTGLGTDGICFWDSAATTPACRLMVCSDVTGGTTTLACQSGLAGCVSNGTACIPKAACNTYNTKTSCSSGGTDTSICVFTASTAVNATTGSGTCAQMTGCNAANNDNLACIAAIDRCAWSSKTTTNGTNSTTTTSCNPHTCDSNYQSNKQCANFRNWANSAQQVCTLNGTKCVETDPSSLSQANCFTTSSYTYTWNTSTSKCSVCTASSVTNNTNNTNSTNQTNDTTTTSGYILGFATVVFSYIII